MRTVAILAIVCALPGLAARDAGAATGWAQRSLALGIERFRAGDYAQALVHLSAAARAPGIDPSVHLYRGYSLYKLGRYAAATESLRRALAADRTLDGPLPRFYLGLALFRRRLYLAAKGELEKVVSLAGQGRLVDQAHRFLEAIAGVVRAADPATALAYHEQGLAALARARPRRAVDEFEEELRWLARFGGRDEHQRREALLYLAGALCLAGRCREVTARLGPDVPRGSHRLKFARAMALAGAGKLSQARALLVQVIRSSRPQLRAAAETLLRELTR